MKVFSNTSLTVHDTFNNNVTLIISVDELQEAHGYLYFDDLKSNSYKDGEFMNVSISFSSDMFRIRVTGNKKYNVTCVKIIVYGLSNNFIFNKLHGKFVDGVLVYDNINIPLYISSDYWPFYYLIVLCFAAAIVLFVSIISIIACFCCKNKSSEETDNKYEKI